MVDENQQTKNGEYLFYCQKHFNNKKIEVKNYENLINR